MIFLCTLNFNIQEEQLIFLKNFLSQNEIEALKEEREATPDLIELEPIAIKRRMRSIRSKLI
jgi:hypothetical protein